MIRNYQAELKGHSAPPAHLNDDAAHAYQCTRLMCEWHLGRERFIGKPVDDEADEEHMLEVEPLHVEEIIACLKRIRKSIDRWNKELGRRGYFDFVNQFF